MTTSEQPWHPRVTAVERDVYTLKRTVYGIQNEVTLEWQDGLLQSNQDIAKNLRLAKEYGFKIGIVIALSTVLNTLHAYGISEAVVGAIGSVFGGVVTPHATLK